jgi:hypothetical protein
VDINGLDSDSSFNGSITAIANNAWKNQDFQFTTKHSPLAFTYHNGSCGGSTTHPNNSCNFSWSTNIKSSGKVEVYSFGTLVNSFSSQSADGKTYNVEFELPNNPVSYTFKINATSGGESVEVDVNINQHSA